MTQRNVALYIVLTIVTCGIFGLYWFVVLTNDANAASGRQNETSGGVALLLTIVTCGIYGLFWAYQLGQKVTEAKAQRGMMADSNASVLYLILSLFGLGIITYALAQSELNKLA